MNIEPLEPHIAPASILAYTDIDGDRVSVTSSSGSGDLNAVGVAQLDNPGAARKQLQGLTLDAGFTGTNLVFTVTKAGGGDGLAHLGFIEASGVKLGNVTIKGDLGKIDCGNADLTKLGLKTLTVRSLGRFGTDTGASGFSSFITGPVGALVVKGDVVGVQFFALATGQPTGIGAVTIGGSLIGAGNFTGEIASDGGIGPVEIGKDIVGGPGDRSGTVRSDMRIASVTVGGSIIGGSGVDSGRLFGMLELGPVQVGKSVIGGGGERSGIINCGADGEIASVAIGGALLGGAGKNSGGVFANFPA